ncbi:hypothetical protein K7432_013268 [Basidiobolus ranarum]|uniref:THH1/TOM1/TOM3 domain-containing protein n=1 Tax=Basidiobolus ranarum TaxID=34480 RepID=A0ABR2WJH1_9FUNG
MTHLSDYTYLDRLVCNTLALLWVLYRIQSFVGFREAFSPKRIRKGELRPIVTIIMLVSNILVVVYDVIVTMIKYKEGYVMETGTIISKPRDLWSEINLKLLPISDSLLDFSFAFLTSALFLFQATWNYIVQTYFKKPFMNSTEFHLCVAYSFLSFLTYALLQFTFIHNKTESTIIPQFFFSAEAFVLIAFAVVNHIRLNRTLHEIEESSKARKRLEISVKSNIYLGIFIAMMGVPLFIINIDILTGSIFVEDKFASDLLMKFFNIGYPGVYIFLCMSLYPYYDQGSCNCSGIRRVAAGNFVEDSDEASIVMLRRFP